MRSIRVLLVDDHDLVRVAIRRLLADASGIRVVGEVGSGEAAIEQQKQLRPQVVLMDVKMSGMGGLEATRRLLRCDPAVRVIALTAFREDPLPTKFLQAGAAGYLTKNAGAKEMVDAIRMVVRGQRYLSPDVAHQLALKHLSRDPSSPFARLSDREMQVLDMVVHGHSAQCIAEVLCLTAKTINTYRNRLFDKLNVKNDVEMTLLAIRHGVLDPDVTARL